MIRHTLTYQPTPEMQNRAMLSWVKPMRGGVQNLRGFDVWFVPYAVAIIGIVALPGFDIISRAELIAGTVGFFVAMTLWAVTHRYSTRKLMGFSNQALTPHRATTAIFTPDYVEINSEISVGRMDWRCFDGISQILDATVMRAGGLVYPVPDHALPQGTSSDEFRANLKSWLEDAR